jgi:hypothetical protein
MAEITNEFLDGNARKAIDHLDGVGWLSIKDCKNQKVVSNV